MNEKPLERLNYYNGQRLQAADLKLEQDYHIRVRRWLNRSLYSSGIADGLAVYAIKGQPLVRVTPGLAIDHLGREVILLEEQIVPVVGGHHERNGKCDGPYLSIRYREDIVGKNDLSCDVGGSAGNRAAWGGPGRILAEAVLELSEELPHEESGRIPLACLTLAPGCDSVQVVDTRVRRDIGDASASKVKQYALEGVRDIDSNNKTYVRFHIRGRQPNGVSLFLRADKFPSYFYTELGNHSHSVSVAFQDHQFPAHAHPLDGISTPAAGEVGDGAHGHTMLANMGDFFTGLGNPPRFNAFAFTYMPGNSNPGAGAQYDIYLRHHATNLLDHLALELSFGGGDHVHTFLPNTGTGLYPQTPLSHVATAGSSPESGLAGADILARTGEDVSALGFCNDLQVIIDKINVTDDIVAQLKTADPDWQDYGADLLGNGHGDHPLVTKGSGEIKLHFLPGIIFAEGEHTIELSLSGDGNGGRIYFNLYVE